MQELISAVGNEKVGVKISPFNPYAAIVLNNPIATYNCLIEKLNKLNFAYVELMRRSLHSTSPENDGNHNDIKLFDSKIHHIAIANAGYNKASAEAELEKGIAKLISFGRLYIANSDLTERFKKNASLSESNATTIYGVGKQGYTNYLFCNE
jgi:N-ethylmaleimide reductase